ncbi:protein GDAP2 homolog [Sitophilus oryzae]|uniref:Protein GDAP2 homolog n=1 Tax=Sitophilus oryzae TaxID=7048 RepID=A0A6J2YQA0_SITOR|nr:protein GDAP2 homolog [Sitophilus oryzae]XP_030765518.1 protein GDAP2 homolog [Sitophilus oryzae]XP_030765519.1 protein GDAP2 homolog [Sitophilus oryzae]
MRIVMEPEPLGIPAPLVRLKDLPRWGDAPLGMHTTVSIPSGGPKLPNSSPFPLDDSINRKIILWDGDIASLQVDAVVNSTNESLNDSNPVSDSIFHRAGPNLKEEIRMDVRECQTGEVKVTQGYSLPARYIIHTVGPKYNIKYQTASENTLHMCYRNVLQKAKELNIRSLAIPVINSVKRNYPPDQGAHIALRTVRRFMETHGATLDTVIFVVDKLDLGIYEVLLPLYFPRSKQEESAARYQLPSDIGGFYGEPIMPDRQIRIIDNPQHTLHADDESLSIGSHLEVALGDAGTFAQMQADPDRQRLLGERPLHDPIADIMLKEIQHQERYEKLLRRARSEDLTEVSGIGCLYQSGVDRLGRPVVVFVGKWFPFNKINLDKALLYLIYLLDPIVKGDYVIAYFHTLTSSSNYPSFSWLREVYNVLPYKYKKNLKAFYVVHPTFWTKMMTWWFTTFMAPAIKQKVHSLPGVEYLYSVMSPDQLEIPAFITEYDMTINGLRYFQPGGAPT